MSNRGGNFESLQIGTIFAITDLATANFKLDGGLCFQIKNEGTEAVTLEVQLASMPAGTFVETKFEPGWNPEIVRVVKLNETAGMDLKGGY